MVLIGEKWLYSGKNGCNWAKVVLFGQIGSIRAIRLYYGNRVTFEQKWLYSGKMVVFGQNWLYLG